MRHRRQYLAASVIAATLGTTSALARPLPVRVPTITGTANEYFTASIIASQRTIWKTHTTSGGDCSETWTLTPKGSETVKLSAPKRKLLLQRIGNTVLMHVGSWDPTALNTGGWIARGTTNRVDNTILATTPGTCGPPDGPVPLVKEDCGQRARMWDVAVGYDPSKRAINLETYAAASQPQTGRFAPFSKCPVQIAGNRALADSIAAAEIPIPAAHLFGGYGKQILLGHRTWHRDVGGDSATTTVNWELTLVRVRRR